VGAWHKIVIRATCPCFFALSRHIAFKLILCSRRPLGNALSGNKHKTATYKIYKFAGAINVPKTSRGTMFSAGDWVFEYDPAEYKEFDGYGPCAGKITDPHVKPGPYIEWADGQENGPIAKKYLRKAPQPGTYVKMWQKDYSVINYTRSGVKVRAGAKAATKKRKAATPTATTNATATKKAAPTSTEKGTPSTTKKAAPTSTEKGTPTLKWKPCKAPSLSKPEHARLADAFALLKTDAPGYYPFVHRCMKEYKSFMKDKSSLIDDLHTHRGTLIDSAIARVLIMILTMFISALLIMIPTF